MTTLTRPSLADIEAAFEALDAEGKFFLLDRLAEKAGADLPREVAYQIIENDEDGRLGFYRQGNVDARVDRLWSPLGKSYRETRDTAILEAMQERRADKGEGM